ncbi:MAG: TraB/GumN family protein [Deltaproteobacteria bacterium]|nr:TraB/GumN family protein [Deltaproteobacteria bacterium]MBW2447529.1 TraB/GumN family protein [Deltaproteobacteria bacterium]
MPRLEPLPLALLLALAVVSGCAGHTPKPEPYLTPLAWEARSPTYPGSVYLLGSIHVGSQVPRRLHPEIIDAWARAEELVVEVDLDAAAPQMAGTWVERALLPAGERLQDVVAPETWGQLSAHLEARNLDPADFQALKPWAALLRLARAEFEREGFPAEYGVDRRFLDAAAGSKPIVALESYALQLDLYDGFSFEVQELMLRDILQPEDPYQTSVLVDAWARGDEQLFLDILFPEGERWAAYRERFYYQRNEAMARKLGVLARDGKTRFVVVGVGHMVGPRGIPALLAGQGFRIQRIAQP